MILIIDNYDSFTYNIYQYIGELYGDVKVIRNDEITVPEVINLNPEAVIISPGPGYPENAGISIELIKKLSGKTPILGVCLGHQAVASAFGGKTIRAKELVHGKKSLISIDTSSDLFSGLPNKIEAARYHSLIVDMDTLPSCLTVTAKTEDGAVMAFEHKEYPVYGVQFHPESVLTQYGKIMLLNFVRDIAKLKAKDISPDEMPKASDKSRMKKYIKKVMDGEKLSMDSAKEAMECIMEGGATDAQIGSFLAALRLRGETVDEITGFAAAMRNKMQPVYHNLPVTDIVGTGGDSSNSFNISTTSAIVAAACGAKIAKHGNRSVSSASGSADVLECLNVKIDITPDKASKCLEKTGLAFMFAPVFHKSMKYAAPARSEMGVRSVFNILGPLSNPAFSENIVLGVYEEKLLETMAKVLMNLGVKRALIVYGEDGLDEITVTGKTKVCEVKDNKLIKYEISPQDFALPLSDKAGLTGGTPKDNAEITFKIFKGEKGAKRNAVLMNTAAALYVSGITESIADGIAKAAGAIDKGCALNKLNELVYETNSL